MKLVSLKMEFTEANEKALQPNAFNTHDLLKQIANLNRANFYHRDMQGYFKASIYVEVEGMEPLKVRYDIGSQNLPFAETLKEWYFPELEVDSLRV